jgi:hypothetical protein
MCATDWELLPAAGPHVTAPSRPVCQEPVAKTETAEAAPPLPDIKCLCEHGLGRAVGDIPNYFDDVAT